jgi:polar amino acid transport system permease protein
MIEAFFNIEIMKAAWPIVLTGLWNTILLSLIVVPLGLLGGLILALLASIKNPLVRWPLMAWVDFFRAFPPLVLLVLLFAGLPFAGLELGGFACVAIAFFLNTGSYYGEIFRAGIDSVPAGQVEAARSTGLTRMQAMRYVVLPQAVRNVMPDLLSNTLEVVKLTSLGSVVAVPELLYEARQAQSITYNPTPIVMAAVIYFLLLWPLVRLLSRLENRAREGLGQAELAAIAQLHDDPAARNGPPVGADARLAVVEVGHDGLVLLAQIPDRRHGGVGRRALQGRSVMAGGNRGREQERGGQSQ